MNPDVRIRGMTLDDLPAVLSIDQQSFPVPWSERTYRFELTQNKASNLLVAESITVHNPVVIGYIGYWLIVDEMHISTLAVGPAFRKQGVGDRLLATALAKGRREGAVMATLEVRKSNVAAIQLYQKYGFQLVGERKGYYRDNHEDALIMTAEPISTGH